MSRTWAIQDQIPCSLLHGLILLCLATISSAVAFGEDQRPNVLMIAVDDMNDWIGCLGGNPQTRTPRIDRLAKRGMLFTNAHCAAPVCNASRTATLTGLRPSTTGIYDNSVKWHEVLPQIPSLPGYFRSRGYLVVGGGKINHHMPGFNRSSDWDEYFNQVFTGHYQARLAAGFDVRNFQWPSGYPLNGIPNVQSLSRPPRNAKEFDWGPIELPDDRTGDGQMVRWAESFLSIPHDRPFFLAAGIYRPHLPFYAPRSYFQRHPLDRIQRPPTAENDLDDLSEMGRFFASQRREDLDLVKRERKFEEMIQAYLSSITFADTLVGRLLDALDRGPAAGRTIVVFWSDHGWHFGEKQALHKLTLWERSTRVPFILATPGSTTQGRRCHQPVGLVDLFPTLNELCSLPAVEQLDGTSLVGLLESPERAWDRPAITTHGQGNHSVRSRYWRYIRYRDGSEELYDHREDPNEWDNLAGKEKFQPVINRLRDHLPGKNMESRSRRKNYPLR